MVEIEKKTLVISGSTGWLGRELLESLTSPTDQLSIDSTLISSKSRIVRVTSGREFSTQTYDDLALPKKVDGFVNLAFLTREKVAKFGYETYVLRNLELISQACRIIETARPKWIVSVSSGAVFKAGTAQVETDIRQNPYGFLKRVEELLIADAAQKIGATLIVGRLWGSSGGFMPKHRDYALSDFLCSALDGEPIHIRSGRKVFRRYCDAGEFMGVLLALALEGKSRTIESGGDLIEIGDLASEIATYFPQILITREPITQEAADDYYSRSEDFETEAGRLGIRLSSIREQVARTLEGHRALSG